MTQALIECFVRAVHEHQAEYCDPLGEIIRRIEFASGYKRNVDFKVSSIEQEMSKYQ